MAETAPRGLCEQSVSKIGKRQSRGLQLTLGFGLKAGFGFSLDVTSGLGFSLDVTFGLGVTLGSGES